MIELRVRRLFCDNFACDFNRNKGLKTRIPEDRSSLMARHLRWR